MESMTSYLSLCGVCKNFELSSPSGLYCTDCKIGLCNECGTKHSDSLEFETHRCQELQKDALEMSLICSEHNEKYQMYCDVHECPCCPKCTMANHKDCKTMLSIDDVEPGVKISHALRECEINMDENKENIAMIIENRKKNLLSLQQSISKIRDEIQETRNIVNCKEIIDKPATQLLNELLEIEELHVTKINDLVISLEKKARKIGENLGVLSFLQEHASDQHIFLFMKRMVKLTLSDREYLDRLCSSDDLNNISLSLELNESLQNVEHCISLFGTLSLSFTPCDIVFQGRKDKQAQLHVPGVGSVDSITLDLIRSIDIKKKWLNGCCFLPDKRYCVTSNDEKCILVMKEDGTVQGQVNVKPYCVIDVAHIPFTNTLVVTTGFSDKHRLIIIDINTKKVTRSIKSDTENYGITYMDGDLIYCAAHVGICKMNMTNGKVKIIKNGQNLEYSFITSYQDQLYYTNYHANTVSSCGMDGTTKWVFEDKVLCDPKGICVDNHGFVYVVGERSENLIVISPDGLRYKELLNNKDGVDYPQAVIFERNSNQILVMCWIQKILLYNVD